LMDLTLHPQFAQNHFIYIAYAYRGDGQRVRVVRFREAGNSLADRRVIIENIPAARFHAGTRVATRRNS
jgi:aldose sugar dehydrogenase